MHSADATIAWHRKSGGAIRQHRVLLHRGAEHRSELGAAPAVEKPLQVRQAARVAKRPDLREQLPPHRAYLVPPPRQVGAETPRRCRFRSHGCLRLECVQPGPLPDRTPVEPGFSGNLGQRLAFVVKRLDAVEAQLWSAMPSRLDEVTMLCHLRLPIAVDETGRFLENHDLLGTKLKLPAWGPIKLLFDRVP
jgi:hypothetical protein